jgi:hypothetical protein
MDGINVAPIKLKPVTLRVKDLLANKACKYQVAAFKKRWPRGVQVTEANIRKAMAKFGNVHWLIKIYFTRRQQAWHRLYDSYNYRPDYFPQDFMTAFNEKRMADRKRMLSQRTKARYRQAA